MTVRYVDPVNGNNSWDGLAPNFVSGSNGPKATLNGAEDTPVVASDKVWCRTNAPYRELLTCDVSGTAGNPITYEADNFGVIWPVSGFGRITGANSPDQAATRASCIVATSKSYRTFRGFLLDTTTSHVISCITACSNWHVEDCSFQAGSVRGIDFAGTGTTNTVERCHFLTGAVGMGVYFAHTSVVDNAAHVVNNCVFEVGAHGVRSDRVGGIAINGCLFKGAGSGSAGAIRIGVALTVGQTVTVNDSIFINGGTALSATVSGEIVENNNTFFGNTADRGSTATGTNSKTYPPLFNPPRLLAGFQLPQFPPHSLSEWSAVRAITATGAVADDLFGLTRPATAAKKSWGPVQWTDAKREASTVDTGTYSMKLADAGMVRVRRVPVTAVSTTIALRTRWETDYAGTKPRMVIKQPGQADRTTTATGAVNTWEALTDTFTPAASPGWVDIFIESSNTATSGSYGTFVDNVAVS